MGNLKADALMNKLFTLLLGSFLLVCGGFAYLANAPVAHAQSTGTATDSFTFAVGTTAERVQESETVKTKYSEVRCWNNSATPLYVGSSEDLVYPLCTDTAACPEAALSIAASNVFVKSDSGTLNPICVILR